MRQLIKNLLIECTGQLIECTGQLIVDVDYKTGPRNKSSFLYKSLCGKDYCEN